MPKEITNEEILNTVNDFATQTEIKFDKLGNEVNEIRTTMVTKDYLDDKLSDLRGDLVVLMRKEDTKVKALIEILKKRKVITEEDVKKILTMEPFPQNL
jgi:arsenate reductase-like glutaredoxin family protein